MSFNKKEFQEFSSLNSCKNTPGRGLKGCAVYFCSSSSFSCYRGRTALVTSGANFGDLREKNMLKKYEIVSNEAFKWVKRVKSSREGKRAGRKAQNNTCQELAAMVLYKSSQESKASSSEKYFEDFLWKCWQSYTLMILLWGCHRGACKNWN